MAFVIAAIAIRMSIVNVIASAFALTFCDGIRDRSARHRDLDRHSHWQWHSAMTFAIVVAIVAIAIAIAIRNGILRTERICDCECKNTKDILMAIATHVASANERYRECDRNSVAFCDGIRDCDCNDTNAMALVGGGFRGYCSTL